MGDSLNRNMWESMVCTLRSSVKDRSKVFEASGRQEFRTEHSYSFLSMAGSCSSLSVSVFDLDNPVISIIGSVFMLLDFYYC